MMYDTKKIKYKILTKATPLNKYSMFKWEAI